ncbi:YicC/YloC family endoribonuclease [Pseudomonadota bacterium]
MTAFARKEYRDDQGELIWELRSVNHRYLETSVRLPEELRSLEPVVRERLGKRLSRGKVDCSLRFRPSQSAAATMKTNERLALQLLEASEEVGHLIHEGVPPSIMDILRWPGVLEIEARDLTPVQKQASELLEEAIDSLIETRQREGARLAEMIQERTAAMAGHVARVREVMPQILEGIRGRLQVRLEELSQELDAGRVEQEMVLLTQRLDVDEEMDRLGAHLDEVNRVLQQDEPVGRRLDFLMQELNRETNTLSSKSNDVETTRIAVDMKVLIEQMREQVQNIE